MTPTEAIEILEHILVGAPDDRANEALQWAIEQLRQPAYVYVVERGEPSMGVFATLKAAKRLFPGEAWVQTDDDQTWHAFDHEWEPIRITRYELITQERDN